MSDNIIELLHSEGSIVCSTAATHIILQQARIEELETKIEELHYGVTAAHFQGYMEGKQKAEAKLAKAVEALKNLADCVDEGCFCSEMQLASAMDEARTTLAAVSETHKLTGGKDG